ncbi:Protein of unknown function [Mucilaginibacter mallensis]|uniref:DUF262 domain-containing protein n=1 Tax=Mucilaginibacter mallensis TaxID=652787 RepID=A0A1H1MB87_MUCMA|nr:DUF262 domain-containing protein [Mucilaginibacter mallensis]SDR84006.1 Protein of unknown function [Mucilaginibacter mallensis]
MNNEADNSNLQYKAIEDVFQVKYFIDFYQRDYTWSSDNVFALLEDSYHRFDLKYTESSETVPDYIRKHYKWYYLNTYIINKQGDRTCIVDGQQRFSTLTLMLIKLFHLAKEKELSDARIDSVKNLICKATSSGLQFWMGGDDRIDTLADLFKNQKNTKPERPLKQSDIFLYLNYDTVNKFFNEKFKDAPSHYLECFIIFFLTNVKLVEIEIKESDDVAMVFEVINAKGQKLKSHEILKAQLLSQIPKDEIDEYLRYWNTACTVLQNSGLKFPNIDDPVDAFFTYYFRARYSKTTTEIQVFKDYHKTIFSRDWQERLPFKKDAKFVKNFIKTDFIYYATKMAELVSSTLESNKYVYYNIKLNEITNLYLVILSAIKPNDAAYYEKVKLLAQLVDRHYMVLRLQGCYDSNSFTRQITSLVINLREKDDLVEIKQDFDDGLISDINKTRSANVTELFNYGFFKDTKVNSSNKTFIRYLLARIEEFLCLEMNYANFAGYNNLCVGKKYHIEHILAYNDENKTIFGNEDFFNEQRDRLGGLLLLKKGDNGMSLAEVYADKLKTYTNDTNFARTLTQYFYHNNSGLKLLKDKYPSILLSAIDNFDEKALDSRHALIYNICKTIWSDDYISLN